MAKKSFELWDGEVIIRQGKAAYLKPLCDTKRMMTYLTNFRLVMWGKDDASSIFLILNWSLLGIFLVNLFRQDKIVLELPITSIEDIEIRKTGFTRKLVLTVEGKQHHLIPANDIDLWMEDIKSMIGARNR